MTPQRQWIVTADARRATLYSCRTTPGGELNVEPVRSLENAHENEHERHRPAMIGGSERRGALGSSSAAAAPHSVSFGHTKEEETSRFAREVAAWLNTATREAGEGHVSVFAAPRFLGLLRSELAVVRNSDRNTDLREGELTHLHPQQLAVHPAVLRAVKEVAIRQRKGE